MDDEAKKKLKKILENYTPEQLDAPDTKYGTIEKRIAAVYQEDPRKVEEEFSREVEEQQVAVGKHAANMQTASQV